MNLQQAQQELRSQLSVLYEPREAATIADWVMEKITGRKKTDRLVHKQDLLSGSQLETWNTYKAELLTHRPVQYVLGESWWGGMKFYVDENVLIPRPETEELVDWIVEEFGPGNASPALSLLDVGTGSGCIAIALQKKLSRISGAGPTVYAIDRSEQALSIARRNAVANDAVIGFRQTDFLDSLQWEGLPAIHVLVSNPPYIPAREKQSMSPHVTAFEPHLALFVEDDDALIFYKALACFAKQRLLAGGSIFVEIHEDLGPGVLQVFRNNGFAELTLKKDLQGKDRMIKATR